MASSQKPLKDRIKHSKSRPPSTAIISQPAVEDITQPTALSSFSLNGQLFAFLSLAVDKHRLRVYNTTSGQSIAEYLVDNARVSALSWATLNFLAEPQSASLDDAAGSPSKKKQKKRNSAVPRQEQRSHGTEVVVLGLSDGTTTFFSPSHGRILRTLSHPSSSSAILAIVPSEGGSASDIWTSGADGVIRLWDVQKNNIRDSWKTDDRISYTCAALRPSMEDGRTDLLVAHHSIRLLSIKTCSRDLSPKKPVQLASFTGHASSVKLVRWIHSRTPPECFVTMAESDRFLYVWRAEDGESREGRSAASIPLDSDVRTFALSKASGSSSTSTLATLSATGKISVYPIPEELHPLVNTSRSAHEIPTILPRSSIVASSKTNTPSVPIIDITFSSSEAQSICVARLARGIQPVFDTIKYVDDVGNYISNLILEDVDLSAAKETHVAPTQRYTEASAAVVGSGTGLGVSEQDEDREVDGELKVDLAELSLGQRLTAVNGNGIQTELDSDNDETELRKHTKQKKKTRNDIPANSLTRTLIQALHSSDTRLLETCLAHSDPTLIRNTVRRLPPQLAVPLITACAERLGRGARATNMKGGGGGASAQRGTGLIVWAKTVLTVHAGHLMTIPDLVARLSGLYSTITARLSLHENLLALNGKLDMVLSQIEMRSSAAPTPLAPRKGKLNTTSVRATDVKRYVEGQSESSEDEDIGAVQVESSDDDASVEDVELGGESEDEDSEEDNDSEDDDDDEDEDEGPTMNGFIDDEAEEWSDEDGEDDSE